MKRFISSTLQRIYQKLRVYFYILMSERKVEVKRCQPIIIIGQGEFDICETVKFGVRTSPLFYSSYAYIEARKSVSKVIIGANTVFNNNASIIADGGSINIGRECIIGSNFQVINSDFHSIVRNSNCEVKMSDVSIGDNVFIGNNVSILKGVNIPSNSVIANGSVVVNSFSDTSVIGGNPAKVLKLL